MAWLNPFWSSPKAYVRPPKRGLAPELWASRIPFTHLENFYEVFRALWENRDNLPYAWRILKDGVCDGCALGTSRTGPSTGSTSATCACASSA